MSSRKIAKLVHEGHYAAEVEVTLIETDHEWSPYYSLEDAMKLDRVREALKNSDLAAVVREAKVFELKPVAAE